MQKAIFIYLHEFAPHERRYMFRRLFETRPWAFLELEFPSPPRQIPHDRLLSDDFYVVRESAELKFDPPVE